MKPPTQGSTVLTVRCSRVSMARSTRRPTNASARKATSRITRPAGPRQSAQKAEVQLTIQIARVQEGDGGTHKQANVSHEVAPSPDHPLITAPMESGMTRPSNAFVRQGRSLTASDASTPLAKVATSKIRPATVKRPPHGMASTAQIPFLFLQLALQRRQNALVVCLMALPLHASARQASGTTTKLRNAGPLFPAKEVCSTGEAAPARPKPGASSMEHA